MDQPMQQDITDQQILNPATQAGWPQQQQSYETTHLMPSQSVMVFGGTGGAGATTLVNNLQAKGVRAFEPQCHCVSKDLLSSNDPQTPKTRILVVPATVHGAETASRLTAQFPIQMVAIIRTTPLTLPFSARTRFRAITGRADTILFPHVWAWRKGDMRKASSAYNQSLEKLYHRIQAHLQLERSQLRG